MRLRPTVSLSCTAIVPAFRPPRNGGSSGFAFPFLRALINIDDTSIAEMMGVRGVLWLLPESFVSDGGVIAEGLRGLTAGLTPLVFVLPVAYACFGRSRLPLVALVLVLVNALWLTAFSLFDAVVWATVAHGAVPLHRGLHACS